MLDLESAIKHCEEMAEKNEEMCRVEEIMGLGLQNTEMMKCARTYKQLAEWLKELKQFKEQEPCEDCVSRAEALEVIKQMDIPEDMIVKIGVEIGTLPPVTSAQKKGKWEQYGDFWKEKYRCFECKEEQPKILCGEQIIRLWSNYCPHCGAKMQEVEE